MTWLREATGAILVFAALAACFYAVVELRGHDYVSALVVVVVALALLGAGTELLRASVGE